MEIGNPQTLYTPYGELPFNFFAQTSSALALGGGGVGWSPPADGNGLLIQKITGADGGPIRNPMSIRPHKRGGIIHRFQRDAMIYTVEGILLANTNADRTQLSDILLGATDAILQIDGRHYFQPSGSDARFRTVRLHEAVDLSDDSVGGIAGPRSFTMTLVANDPVAYNAVQDSTSFSDGSPFTIPNVGNTDTWPVIILDGSLSGATVSIVNTDSGFELDFAALTVGGGHTAEINMFNETVYLDGDSTNLLPKVVLATSDFWSVAPGGASVTISGASGHVLSNGAWV